MTDWQQHWSTHPRQFASGDYLRQVGKTVGGQPISDEQFGSIIDDISTGLELTSDDRLLDLCCGNGLISYTLAKQVHSVVGVDYSEPLLEVARRDHQPESVQYHQGSVVELNQVLEAPVAKFDKVLMYEALQHFRPAELGKILSHIKTLTVDKPRIFFGSVPHWNRRWNFYNTWKRKLDYWIRTLRGKEAIGTWWRLEDIEQACSQFGWQVQVAEQSKNLHTAHYRFDLILT